MDILTKKIKEYSESWDSYMDVLHPPPDFRSALHAHAAEIFKHPISDVIKKYVRFYNQNYPEHLKSHARDCWHLLSIFSQLPLQVQLALIDKTLNKHEKRRTAFDRNLICHGLLIKALNFPRDSQHEELFNFLDFGWIYYINHLHPSQKEMEVHLRKLMISIKSLKDSTRPN